MNNRSTRKPHFVFLRRLPDTVVWGGVEKIILDWFERIDYAACRVTLAVRPEWRDIFARQISEKGLPVHLIVFPFDLEKGGSLKNFRDMYRFLRPLRASAVIFCQGAFTDFRLATVFAGFLAFRRSVFMHENLGVPDSLERWCRDNINIFSFQNIRWRLQRFLSVSRSLLARKIFVVSREIKEQLVRLWGYPERKVVVAYHGIEIDKFRCLPEERRQMRESLNVPMGDFVFIMSSRLAKEKRIDRAIEAFDRLAGQHRDIWLLIVGDGSLGGELKQIALQKKSRDHILFLGYRENIPKLLNAADGYVNSSDKEGLSISLLEAMSAGLVCVATDCPGSIELFQESQTGFLTDKSVDGVFAGMQKVMSLSEEERDSMAAKSAGFVQQRFEINRQVKEVLDAMGIPSIVTGGGHGGY